jgi:hypothetical protein
MERTQALGSHTRMLSIPGKAIGVGSMQGSDIKCLA